MILSVNVNMILTYDAPPSVRAVQQAGRVAAGIFVFQHLSVSKIQT